VTLPPAAEIQRFAQLVLSRAEFRETAAAAPGRETIWRKVADWLIAHRVAGELSLAELLGWITLAGIVLTLVVALVRAFRSRPERSSLRTGAHGRMAAAGDGARSPAPGLIARAQAALAAGDGRGSIGLLYQACLALLTETGAATPGPWKTNTTYLRECPPSAPLYPVLRDLTSVYDEVVYGHRAAEPPRIASLTADLRALCSTP
jgi:hypothetical protein